MKELKTYLNRLGWALKPLPPEERQDIVRELETHFEERLQEEPGLSFSQLTEPFGRPEEYARQFLQDYHITRAIAGGNGFLMLAQALRMLNLGLKAFMGGLAFLTLYGLAFSMFAVAIMKFILPAQVGLFTHPDMPLFFYGIRAGDPLPGLHEHLGYWIVPLSLVLGAGLYRVTTAMLKWFLLSFREG